MNNNRPRRDQHHGANAWAANALRRSTLVACLSIFIIILTLSACSALNTEGPRVVKRENGCYVHIYDPRITYTIDKVHKLCFARHSDEVLLDHSDCLVLLEKYCPPPNTEQVDTYFRFGR